MVSVQDKKVSLGFGKRQLSVGSGSPTSPVGKWRLFSAIASDAAHEADPWQYMVQFPTEKGTRYRYDVTKKEFFTDEVSVKIETKPFANGAMRECYKMKKLSHFVSKTDDWNLPFTNVVCKRYMKDVDRDTYFDDVKLQMDAKYWAEQYNRADPPKKIDIMQMMIVELSEREGRPLYHVESLIEGDYVKYNSNSGFVEVSDHHVRNTPQAFSHFTFESSGHKLMVVDVQGVGDLYTDPQIHTYDGDGYGAGNLATNGMALFFNTHRCNVICQALGLSEFDLTKKERKRTTTVGDGVTQFRCTSPSEESSEEKSSEKKKDSGIGSSDSNQHGFKMAVESASDDIGEVNDNIWDIEEINRSMNFNSLRRRPSCVMSAISIGSVKLEEEEEEEEKCERGNERATILGQIHWGLAVYHYMGRFEEDRRCDSKSCLFHLIRSAECGLAIGELTLAQLHLDLYHDELKDLQLEEQSEKEGRRLLESAARHGVLYAILKVGQMYNTGLYNTVMDWKKASKYFEKYCSESINSTDSYSSYEPMYKVLALCADMLATGGHGLVKNPLRSGELYTEAAESAMCSGQGRLANKWYMLAEEVWAECEEE